MPCAGDSRPLDTGAVARHARCWRGSGMVLKKGGPTPLSGMRERVARILVIDDEAKVAKSLQLVLAHEFDVSRATEPQRALEGRQGGGSFEVSPSAAVMPGVNGVELRNRVAEFSPDQAARIVFITGG